MEPATSLASLLAGKGSTHLALARVFDELARSRHDALDALGDGRPV